MTDDSSSPLERFEDSRRSLMKKSALAAVGTGVAAGGVSTAAAQEGGDDGDGGDGGGQDKALMYTQEVRPGANFIITSPVLEWVPNVGAVRENDLSDYNTRMIRYTNTQEQVLFFQAHEAEVPQFEPDLGYVPDPEGDEVDGTPQPEVYNLDLEPALFGDTPWLMTVNFSPVGEDEADAILEQENWWPYDDENGTQTDSA